MNNLSALPFQRFLFTLRCQTPMRLGEFVANELRGGFGAALHALWCEGQQEDGASCPLPQHRAECLYASLFDSRDSQGRRTACPYVLEPLFPYRTNYETDDEFRLGLLLIGRALHHLPDCWRTFQHLGERGLGHDYRNGQGRFAVERIETSSDNGGYENLFQNGRCLMPPVRGVADVVARAQRSSVRSDLPRSHALRRVELHFVSPLHLREARPPQRTLREIEFHHLWDSLQGRLETLMKHHGGEEYRSEFRVLKEAALDIRKVEDSLRWEARCRRTSKGQQVDMGGLLGHISFEGDMAPFLDVLTAGEWLHYGHGADLGNGRYRLSCD